MKNKAKDFFYMKHILNSHIAFVVICLNNGSSTCTPCWWLSDYIVWEKIESVKWFLVRLLAAVVVVVIVGVVLFCIVIIKLLLHWSTYHKSVKCTCLSAAFMYVSAHMLFIWNDFRKFRNIVPFAAKHKREHIFSGLVIRFFFCFKIPLHVKRQK